MANTASSKQPLSYAFSYGFAGGPLHARKFKHLMHLSGYAHSQLPQAADIIIAHSAGCWLIPKDCRPKLIMYVGMPLAQLRPLQSLLAANQLALRPVHLLHTLGTKAKATYYGLRQPRRNLKIVRMTKTAKPVIMPNIPAIFIANQHDPWPKSAKLKDYLNTQVWAFISLFGTHDDIWEHSERYVAIINHYARLLAKADG